MISRREVAAIARLEFAEVLRSRWLVFCLVVYALFGAGFVLVGLRESSVMGFTGMGRALFSLTHVLMFLLPLLGLTVTGQVINGARDDGAIELLLGHPVSREGYFVAVSLVRSAVLLVPLVVLMLAMALYGWLALGQGIPWDYLTRTTLVSSALLLCFVSIGLAVSTFVRSQAKALMILLLIWAACVALIDFAMVGLLLQWRLPPSAVFALASLNPVQDARLALLAAAEPELATLGPVGFFLANQIGPGGLVALGLVWPLLLGAAVWAFTLRRFQRTDLI